jgi:hypothetical protein
MPTAIPFTALGRGNGFSSCPTSVDVSGFDHWVTLGGYAKTSSDDVTTEQINDSRINAMELFWNTELVKTSVSAEASNPSSSATINTQNFEHKIMKTASVALEPRERVCYDNLTGLSINEDVGTFPGCQAIIHFKLELVRMYNGAITDINNFVGFGFNTLIDGLCVAGHSEDGRNIATVESDVSSYLDGTTESGTSSDGGEVTKFNKAVYDFTVNSIPFKAFNRAFVSTTSGSLSPTFVNQATKVSAVSDITTDHSDAEIDLGTNLSLSSYTYD